MDLYDWAGPWYESLSLSHKIMGALLIVSVLLNGWFLWHDVELRQDLRSRTAALEEAEQRIKDYLYEDESRECTLVYVHLSGEVNLPGVYALGPGVRLFEALEQAGGTTPAADLSDLNLVALLRDGCRVHIPAAGDSEAEADTTPAAGHITSGLTVSGQAGLIDINSATLAQLTVLPGVGEVKARDIISFRESTAPFEKKEDIMKVSGIGQATYARIKDRITVQ